MDREKVFYFLNWFFRKLYFADIFCFAATYLIVLSNPIKETSSINVSHTATTYGAIFLATYLSIPGRRKRNAVFSFLMIFLFASQFLTALCMLFYDRYSNMWRNIMTIHVVAGLEIFGPFLMVYYFRHIYDKRFTKDEAGELFAHVGFSVFRVGLWTGIIAGFATGSMTMIPIHKWTMLAASPIVLSHAGLATFHMLRFPAKRQSLMPRFYASFGLSFLLFVGMLGVLYWDEKIPILAQNEFIARSDPEPVQRGYSFLPSEVQVPGGAVYREEVLGRSQESCGEFGCHKVVYQEWVESPHRRSANVFYEKSLELAYKKGGVAAAKFCAGCHDPILLLSGQIREGHIISETSREEGISCMVCHSITPHQDRVQNASYSFYMPERFFKFVQNIYTVHDLKDEHLDDFLKDVYKTPEYCGSCHRAVLPKAMTGASEDIVEQDPYTSWLNGPYRNKKHPEFKQRKDCNHCHMPRITQQERPVPLSPSHRFAASNTAMPYLHGEKKQLQATKAFLKNKVLRVKIERAFFGGGQAKITVAVENTGTGHVFPAGPLDINEVWIELKVTKQGGKVVYWSGFMGKNNHVEKNARFFKVLELDEKGKEIEGHNILKVVQKRTVRIIPPKGKILETFEFPVTENSGTLTVSARVNYRKFNQRFVDWVFGKGKVFLPVVTVAGDRKKIGF